MKIFNILFNFKKGFHSNKILGVERCFVDYTKFLSRRGHKLVSVTKPDMVYKDEISKFGEGFYEVPAFGKADIYSVFYFVFLFFKHGIDVAICHSGRAIFLTRIARFLSGKKFPIIAIDHGINPKKYLKADYILAVNKYFAQRTIENGKSKNRVGTIPNMIEVAENFQKLQKKPFSKKIKLGSLGRLYIEKNFDKVLKALAILKERNIDCYYEIGGVGIEEDRLNKMAKDLGVEENFNILGWTSDKRKFFENIDIFILPSFGETFGIVLLEAMLYSTPIISGDSWGPNEIIKNEFNGIKVSISDNEKTPKLIADAVEKLVNDEKLAKELAENAYQEFFKKYTTGEVINYLEEICKKVVKMGKE